MAQTTSMTAELPDLDQGLTASVGMIADRLLRAIRHNGSNVESAQRALLEHALAVAAEAEQRVAEQSQRIAVLEALSVTDELTGLLNRRGFNRQVARVLAEVKRYGDSGILIYFDIDDLKTVNDVHGHLAGDQLLRYVGDLLAGYVRSTDVVGRLGGDEFAVLLVKSNTKTGRQRARELERLVNRSSLRYGGQTIPIRASFGIINYRTGDEAAGELIERADKAMYSRKRGKPRLLEADPQPIA